MNRRVFLEAIDRGDVDAVRVALAAEEGVGKLKIDSPASKYEGRTPLTMALERGLAEIVRLLLAAGADPNRADKQWEQPIFLAVAHPECLHPLLDAGVDLSASSEDYITPLMCASGFPESVRILLDAGVDISAQSRDGETALYFAARDGYQESVEVLMRRMPTDLATEQLAWGRESRRSMAEQERSVPPLRNLRIAMSMGNLDLACELARTIPLAAPPGEEAPILAAIGCASLEVLDILLHRGADPNEGTAGRVPAVLFAVELQSVEMVRRLVAAGADIDAASAAGRHGGASAREYAETWGTPELRAALAGKR